MVLSQPSCESYKGVLNHWVTTMSAYAQTSSIATIQVSFHRDTVANFSDSVYVAVVP